LAPDQDGGIGSRVVLLLEMLAEKACSVEKWQVLEQQEVRMDEQEELELEMVEQLEDLVGERSETRQEYEEEELSAQVDEDLEQ